MDFDSCRDVNGLWIHHFFHEDLIRSVLAYKPRDDDIFLATYPKCGTTWTQYLILSILTDGHPPKTVVDFMLASPFMEMMGAEAAERMARPGLLKTHLPFNLQPYSPRAKYIYVTRNPYDVCVSFYYHMKGITAKKYDASFDRFCKAFIAGKVSCGDYFDHLLSWYEHRNDPNVLFFTYEEMKKDIDFWTLKIADFMGEQDVDGLWINKFFHEDIIRSALAYTPREDDLFLVTYPKCGTTWTQYIILSILTDGRPPKTVEDAELASPLMEMMGAEAAERMVRPGLLKTHLPFNLQPYSPQAKYIYVTRNPYDVCVSFYHHFKSMTAKKYDASFERFCKLFIAGKLSCGDCFDFLLSWYEHRNDPNILFFTYEQMKKDADFWTLKIADFMGEEYGRKLREDPTLMNRIRDA
ncbi:hypothetical protein HPB52_012473 [Rhipicephalus sanguineus]|uniref:Sulfotransferase domain-containing protein n=1 Tax=Rhipicephalus sanguineus TaxID=34632 RepID=A0A9D4T5Y3_RHISA|nr:hypothetical protein HPB52_012473 [Rhipicephalus sanguineus]